MRTKWSFFLCSIFKFEVGLLTKAWIFCCVQSLLHGFPMVFAKFYSNLFQATFRAFRALSCAFVHGWFNGLLRCVVANLANNCLFQPEAGTGFLHERFSMFGGANVWFQAKWTLRPAFVVTGTGSLKIDLSVRKSVSNFGSLCYSATHWVYVTFQSCYGKNEKIGLESVDFHTYSFSQVFILWIKHFSPIWPWRRNGERYTIQMKIGSLTRWIQRLGQMPKEGSGKKDRFWMFWQRSGCHQGHNLSRNYSTTLSN